MQPAGLLMIEHRLIDHMLKLMADEIERIGKYGRVDSDFIDDAVDFMRTYTDHCHHGKEEHILFKELDKKPLSAEMKKMLDELIAEHVFARKIVEDIETAKERYIIGEKNAPADIVGSLNIIIEFYPRHVNKEEKHFFIGAMDYFTNEEKDRMLKAFEDFDARLIHEKYKKMVSRLEGRFAIA
jgi:hemerythrin-like domain-containing protein